MTKSVLFVAFQLVSILAFAEGGSADCHSPDRAQSAIGDFYYVQFSGALVPVPVSLVAVPRESGEQNFSLAFVRDEEVTLQDGLSRTGFVDTFGVTSIWISKGAQVLDRESYQFRSEKLCMIDEVKVFHFKESQARVNIQELIYIEAEAGEKFVVGGIGLERYRGLLVEALSE